MLNIINFNTIMQNYVNALAGCSHIGDLYYCSRMGSGIVIARITLVWGLGRQQCVRVKVKDWIGVRVG